MTDAQYLSGRLLLAMPGMGDPRFDHAVIAMCMHDENGAFGIGVSQARPGVRLHAVLRELDIDPGVAPDSPVLNGGPVEPGRGFVFHSTDWESEGSVEVMPLGALSASLDILRAIADGSGPRQWLIALGYAGWGAGQLDGEMRRHGWFAAAGHPDVLFDTPIEDRWSRAWRAEGIDPSHLASATGHA
ncbi:MAG: YqgE/AlgH family protein [Novosphingobium sp.]|nr:YqgE/AlgH family protein [Novosphingobium sp.]